MARKVSVFLLLAAVLVFAGLAKSAETAQAEDNTNYSSPSLIERVFSAGDGLIREFIGVDHGNNDEINLSDEQTERRREREPRRDDRGRERQPPRQGQRNDTEMQRRVEELERQREAELRRRDEDLRRREEEQRYNDRNRSRRRRDSGNDSCNAIGAGAFVMAVPLLALLNKKHRKK